VNVDDPGGIIRENTFDEVINPESIEAEILNDPEDTIVEAVV